MRNYGGFVYKIIFVFIGKSRQQIAVQLQEARDKFLEIAESHVKALQVYV